MCDHVWYDSTSLSWKHSDTSDAPTANVCRVSTICGAGAGRIAGPICAVLRNPILALVLSLRLWSELGLALELKLVLFFYCKMQTPAFFYVPPCKLYHCPMLRACPEMHN